MLTTSDSDGDIQRALRAGASAYMLKSMPKNELLGVIRSVIDALRPYFRPCLGQRTFGRHFNMDLCQGIASRRASFSLGFRAKVASRARL
jgi:DNA-binding NarL/FixJ family response regulator